MFRATTLHRLRGVLKPGNVYRREDLAPLSSNVDRNLVALVAEGRLKKLRRGLYACPESTVFGEVPPNEEALLRSFLRDDRFVVYSFNAFNALCLGTTQLYNQKVVFNRKRTGEHTLGGRTYRFYRWREAPKTATKEFLVVELLNRLEDLAEDRDQVLARLRPTLASLNQRKLTYAADHYGTYSTQLKLKSLLAPEVSQHA
jgi:hypothetical protein